ncbi:10532_t:CDS:2 [Dentiscutata heterogama]|uniref:10532_t:CDS:1 n=1 Tax=Dentiscutata heterogama TaxID=1316150 RepID=A0ACA9KVS6_9GLOM|nr:10532_t:CDS:2 [Dentiscutata heterogama]
MTIGQLLLSPPMHPYLYSPQSPYGVLYTLSLTLSQSSSSASNSPPHNIYLIPNLPNFNNSIKTTNIYIRGLSPNTTDKSLHNMCSM